MSSNDFDGSYFGPEGGRGADEQGAGQHGAGQPGPGRDGQGADDGARYPEPEGWNQGFWRDSAIDSDYETGLQGPIPPSGPSQGDPGYSYWSDGHGWHNSPRPGAYPGQGPDAGSFGAGPGAGTGGYSRPGSDSGPGSPGGPAQGGTESYGAAAYAPGPGGPRGPAVPGGPGGPGEPGGPPGPRPGGKRKGSWWRRWTWKKSLALVGSFALVFVLVLFGIYEYLSSSATIPPALASATYQNTVVYYNDGKTVLGTIGTTNRQDLTYSQIPKHLQDSVLAAEDRSFWTEGGISPTGILRAAYDDVSGRGSSLSGGSTITQEFVRGYYNGIGAQQTVSRKVKEVFIAQKLTKTKSKSWILTNYMNLIFLGDGSYGVAAAAQTYFNKPVDQLTVAQDAVIAAIIQQPSNYPLPAYRNDLVARWHYVLNGMVTMGDLTQAQADAAKFPALQTDHGISNNGASFTTSNNDAWAPYIMNVVENELTGVDHISEQQLETGGLRVVTTISRPMEVAMYKAVDNNIKAIKDIPGAEYPSYVRVGAELQNPDNGEMIAIYGGPGQSMSTAKCKLLDCDLNTAIYSREQVGSSFKPYVLAAAVKDGMNVKTSTLNANPYLCVPPETEPTTLSSTKVVVSGSTLSCTSSEPGYFAVENDGGEGIGNPKKGGGANVQTALAKSSNTAFTDLTHRVTTTNVIDMASEMGVNTEAFPSGSNLSQLKGQVGLALGTASLTVNEQTTMLSTIADDGVYHAAHIIKYWQQTDGPQNKIIPATHNIYTSDSTQNSALDSQVQYAMDQTTVSGTGTSAAVGLGNRQIIAKTGTTTNSHAGFFIGAIPQYSLVVGMFTQSQDSNSTESLVPLTGGGFGGYWPAKIWNTFAQAEFTQLPYKSFQNATFSGANWNQVGKIAKPKPTVTCMVNGKKTKVPGKSCPTPTPTPSPTPTCTDAGQSNCITPSESASPTPTCSYDGESTFDGCTTASGGVSPSPSPTCSFPGQTGCSSTGTDGATPSPTPTCSFPGQTDCSSTSPGGAVPQTTATAVPATSAKAGLAVTGTGLLLPGSLILALARRRRRRGQRAGTPE